MSETVNLTIDGKAVTVPKGTSVIAAAEQVGIEIPRFCYHPGLSVAGVCRFCMVKVEGMPKLQISCNTQCTEGMKVVTTSEDVKAAHKWALEFHLINHPLDCPICDQAGECELQNNYMKFGKYVSQMEEEKVLKPKALDVGTNLILDTERCILCSRCVRFEDEVTKTKALGIFNRGDHSIIGTFPDKKIEHNYSYNLADICPVGAFTAKDFRFKCRVWFLSETKTICPGCSTGCNVILFNQKHQREYYRLKPRENPEVNGHWMCDYGRNMYHHLNASERRAVPLANGKNLGWDLVTKELAQNIAALKKDPSKFALVFTPQYTNEEYEKILSTLKTLLGSLPEVYVWRNAEEKIDDFDGLLFRGDRNPNTMGLKHILEKYSVTPKLLQGDFSALTKKNPDLTFIFGPEIEKSYVKFIDDIRKLTALNKVVYFGSGVNPVLNQFACVVPTQVFSEKEGTFVNYKGIAQRLVANPSVYPALLGIDPIFSGLLQTDLNLPSRSLAAGSTQTG